MERTQLLNLQKHGIEKRFSRQEFYSYVEQSAIRLPSKEFYQYFGDTKYFFAAHDVSLQFNDGKKIISMDVFVNIDDFFVDTDDYTYLQRYPIRHEAAEIWVQAKSGCSVFSMPKTNIVESHSNSPGHMLALREEFRYAKESDQLQEYMMFLLRWINSKNNMSTNFKMQMLNEIMYTGTKTYGR